MKYDKDVYIDDDNVLERYIDLIIKSNDLNTKKILANIVIISLVNRFKAIEELDFSVSFDLDNKSILGLYNKNKKIINVNTSFMNSLDDFNYNFVLCISSLFHELDHVKQYKNVKKKKLDFNNLIMAIDMILGDIYGEDDYYDNNYHNLSFEIDAECKSYISTNKLFSKYADLIDRYRKSISVKKDNYVRKDGLYYYEIICLFVEKMNYLLSLDKKYKRIFDEYPVIYEFFDIIDNQLRFKTDKYFKKKLSDIEKSSLSIKNKKMVHSIKCFLREKRIYKELSPNYDYLSDSELIDMIGQVLKR